MSYLKFKHNSQLVFDPSYSKRDQSNFQECDWADFYECAVETIPPSSPLLRERGNLLPNFVLGPSISEKLPAEVLTVLGSGRIGGIDVAIVVMLL